MVHLLRHCGHSSFFHDQPAHLFPVGKLLALLRKCKNVRAGVTNGAKHPPVLSRKRKRREQLGKVFWCHRLVTPFINLSTARQVRPGSGRPAKWAVRPLTHPTSLGLAATFFY